MNAGGGEGWRDVEQMLKAKQIGTWLLLGEILLPIPDVISRFKGALVSDVTQLCVSPDLYSSCPRGGGVNYLTRRWTEYSA